MSLLITRDHSAGAAQIHWIAWHVHGADTIRCSRCFWQPAVVYNAAVLKEIRSALQHQLMTHRLKQCRTADGISCNICNVSYSTYLAHRTSDPVH
jgi:uncharacterized protein (DUF1810 family)